MKIGRIKVAFILIVFFQLNFFGQSSSGRIVFERKTNMEKKLKNINAEWVTDFIASQKIRKEEFELFFTDSCAIFKPIEDDEVSDDFDGLTSRNTIYQNFNSNSNQASYSIFQQDSYSVNSENQQRQWKITDSKRMIGMYECRKAIYQKNDSTRIYAWFSNEILSPSGPEGVNGLPGTILGLATEDGGVVYFAKLVELKEVDPDVFKISTKKKNTLTLPDFKQKVNEQMTDELWRNFLFEDLFRW